MRCKTVMELNFIITRWLNGEDFSVNILLPQPLFFLKEKIRRFTKESIFVSFRKSYEKMYKTKPIIYKKTVRNVIELKPEKNKKFLRPLVEFQEYIKKIFSDKEIVGAYIHGSLGTADYIEGYSDFDALLILKKEIFDEEKKLKRVKRKIVKANTFLYLLDPLQHHNLFIISELDMQYYFESIFPLVLFDYAKEITDFGNELQFCCLDDITYLREEIIKRSNYFRGLRGSIKNRTPFDIKTTVQTILLLPTLYLQAKTKEYSYKKFSFETAKKDFITNDEWSIVEKASTLRQRYKFRTIYPYRFRKFIGFNLHYKLLRILHKYFDRKDSKYMLQIIGNDFFEKGFKLASLMEGKLYGDGQK